MNKKWKLNELNINLDANNSFEYFIENITTSFLSSSSDTKSDEKFLYLLNTQRGQLRVYNKITGLPSTEHPRVNDGSAGWSFSTNNESNYEDYC